jgi:hypothetical protein
MVSQVSRCPNRRIPREKRDTKRDTGTPAGKGAAMSEVSRETQRSGRADLLARAANDVERRVIVNATAPTVRRLQRDPLAFMHERGQITSQQYGAGLAIRKVWLAITSSLSAKTMRLDGARGGIPSDWPAELVTMHRDLYKPWAKWAGDIDLGDRHTLAELVVQVAVDGYGVNQVAASWVMHHATVLRWLRYGLDRFAHPA